MCGIAGHYRYDRSRASAETISKMLKKMEFRGPDAEGLFQKDHCALGHRRLKIIDLSEKAQQPMLDHELGLSLVFNGCIYNYKEIRKELETKHYRFFSSSDTEVILKAFHCWREDCLSKFNGMFSFAIFEHETGELFIARDRLGIKPLYYAEVKNSLYFSSSLPALLEIDEVPRELDNEALQFYFSFHAVVPPPFTVVKAIRKLPQGCWMKLKPNSSVEIQSYWQLKPNEDASISFSEALEQLDDYLKKAVERRLVADVPVGVLLSGGLDSSLIVGLLSELGHPNIETFSIGFQSTEQQEGNEFKYSDIIAQAFSTKHHKIEIPTNKLIDQLPDCISAMSEPMVSHDTIGFYLLSKEVSKHVTVVESGQGADEVFGGYHWYPPLMEPEASSQQYLQYFADREYSDLQHLLNTPYQSEECAFPFVRNQFDAYGNASATDKALCIDTSVMLVDDPVKRVDNMTMRWSLEARVPFLDHELVEFAFRLPAKYKVANGGKYILKELGRKYIPNEVIDRPKGYFPVPELKYIQGRSFDFVESILNSENAKNRNLYQKPYLDKLLDRPEEYLTPLGGSKLWQVALLEQWLQVNKL